ncbi:MAG: hypothetical protein WD669_07775, partial [Pirellulales bacterium]
MSSNTDRRHELFPFLARNAVTISTRVSIGLLAMASAFVASARAETWAERLGFPPGAKVLILHATEMGMCNETNAAATQLLESGLVRSA